MKKTIALLLAVLLVLTLVGCGGTVSSTKPADNPGTTKAQAGEQETKQNTPAETDKPTEPATTTEAAPTEPPVVFEEVIAIDNDDCTVKITGIEDDPIWGYTLRKTSPLIRLIRTLSWMQP